MEGHNEYRPVTMAEPLNTSRTGAPNNDRIIRCPCNVSSETIDPMVACDICGNWSHVTCMGFASIHEAEKYLPYACHICDDGTGEYYERLQSALRTAPFKSTFVKAVYNEQIESSVVLSVVTIQGKPQLKELLRSFRVDVLQDMWQCQVLKSRLGDDRDTWRAEAQDIIAVAIDISEGQPVDVEGPDGELLKKLAAIIQRLAEDAEIPALRAMQDKRIRYHLACMLLLDCIAAKQDQPDEQLRKLLGPAIENWCTKASKRKQITYEPEDNELKKAPRLERNTTAKSAFTIPTTGPRKAMGSTVNTSQSPEQVAFTPATLRTSMGPPARVALDRAPKAPVATVTPASRFTLSASTGSKEFSLGPSLFKTPRQNALPATLMSQRQHETQSAVRMPSYGREKIPQPTAAAPLGQSEEDHISIASSPSKSPELAGSDKSYGGERDRDREPVPVLSVNEGQAVLDVPDAMVQPEEAADLNNTGQTAADTERLVTTADADHKAAKNKIEDLRSKIRDMDRQLMGAHVDPAFPRGPVVSGQLRHFKEQLSLFRAHRLGMESIAAHMDEVDKSLGKMDQRMKSIEAVQSTIFESLASNNATLAEIKSLLVAATTSEPAGN